MVCGVYFGMSQPFRALSNLHGGEQAKQALKTPITERGGVGSKREHICIGEAAFLLNVCRRGGYQFHLPFCFFQVLEAAGWSEVN